MPVAVRRSALVFRVRGMASLITARLRFLHVPKTGGSWATSAMHAAGIPAVHPEALPFHADLAESSMYADRFTFAFVRHPLDFWRSYWAYRMRDGWEPASQIDAQAASPDFDEFINRVIARAPGEATALYQRFIGPPTAEIEFVGRFEHLADDLVVALRLAGEPFDEGTLRACPPVNASDYVQLPALYDQHTAERLAASEWATVERFYPQDPVPLALLGATAPVHLSSDWRRDRLGRAELRDAGARDGR
jgi:hypothetical protein